MEVVAAKMIKAKTDGERLPIELSTCPRCPANTR